MGKLFLVLSLSSYLVAAFPSGAVASASDEAQKRADLEDRIESAKHLVRAGWYSFALTYTVNIISGAFSLKGMAECEDDECVEDARIYGGVSFVPVSSTFLFGIWTYAEYPDPFTFALCVFSILHALGQAACLIMAIVGHVYLHRLKKEYAKLVGGFTAAAGLSPPRMALVPTVVQGGAGLTLAGSF